MMIPYGHQSINKSDEAAVLKALRSDYLTQGPAVERFERALAKYVGASYAVVFSSGTAALHAAYFAAGLNKGDEFVTTPMTFAATANAGLYLGAVPVFADINRYGNLDPVQAAVKITARTKMLAVVDYAGNPADLDAFRKLAAARHLVLVEDASHALGGCYGGKKVGAISDLTTFSFHPVKLITTGEGGAVTTNNAGYAEKLRDFRSHGITKDRSRYVNRSPGDWYHEMQALGFNYRLTDIQAALGASQLARIDKFLAARRKIVAGYGRAFASLASHLELPAEGRPGASGWHLYVIRLKGRLIDNRAEIFHALREAGIGVQVHYLPVYLHPYYRKLGFEHGLCPRAENFYRAAISLPIFPSLAAKDQKYVINAVKELVKKYSRI